MQIEHESRERPLEPREAAAQHDEPRAGDFAGAGKIHLPEAFAERHVILRLEREIARRADRAHELVVVLVLAVGHLIERNIGNAREQRVDLGPEPRGLGFEPRLLVLAGGDLLHDRAGIAAFRLYRADLARKLVALGLELLGLGLRRAPLLIERKELGNLGRQAAPRQAAVEGIGIVANGLQIEHGPPL